MNLVGGHPVSLSSSDPLKMEERKRPASNDHDVSAPPLKRQATSANGMKAHPDADMPWKDDLEVSLVTALLPFQFPIGSRQSMFYHGLIHCADNFCLSAAVHKRSSIATNERNAKGAGHHRETVT